MALLEDQIEEAQAAFVAAHDAGDKEGAQVLADHLRSLEAQKATVDTAALESSQAGTDLRNPMIAGGVGALVGSTVNPVRGAVHNIIAPPAAAPKVTAPPPSSLSAQLGQGGENWTKSLTGVDVPNAQMNKGSLDTAQRMAATVGRGGELAGGRITEGGIMLPPEVGAKPTPVAPRTIASQTKQAGKSLLQGIAGEPQPMSPFSIVKGGARGAVTGGVLADIPQQLAQGNYGTAASDVGVAAGNIAHGLAKTPKGKAIGTLLGLGSGVLRGYQGIKELTGEPEEQKAAGGLMHLAEGGQPEFGEARAYEPSYSEKIRDFAAQHIGRERANRLFAGPNARPEDVFNPVSMAAQTPGAIADAASGFVKAGKEGDYLGGMGNYLMGAMNVAPMIKPAGQIAKTAVRELGPKAAGMAEDYLTKIGGIQYAVPPKSPSTARTLVEPTAEEIAKFKPKPTTYGKMSDFLQNHMDEYLGLHQSDRLGTHGNYKGGTGFPNFQNIDPLHAKNDVVWMNMTPEASNKIIANSKINGKDVVFSNYIGKGDQHKSNRGVYNEVLADIYKNNPNMTADQVALINARMKAVTGKDLDIRDKFLMQEEGGGTFDARGNLSRMFGEGFGRGKGKLVLSPNYQNILNEAEEQFTKGAPTSAIGTRLHRVYNEPSQFSTAFHPDYDYTVHGKDLGVQFPAVPHTVLDWTQKYIKEGRGGKGSTLPHGNAWFNYMSDPQHINEPFIKRLQAEGYAPGGKVGAVKKLFDEARAAYKAKFTPGFYHGSPNPNITAFDPMKSTVRDTDFVTPGVTFVTKSPKFADSFTNGKGPYISLKTGEAMPAQSYSKGSTMYPVNVDLSNHFDPTTPEGRELVREYVAKKYADNPDMARKFASRIEDPHSNWTTMESPSFLQHLRDTGHTSFAVNESGYPNVGVLDPTKIRGKFAKFNPEDAADPDFMKAAGGVVGYAPGGKVLGGLAKFLEESKIPQRLYHGTTASEEKGAKALSQLKQSKEGALGAGVYMTPNPEFASMYANQPGGYVMPVHTNLKNPLEIHSQQGGADPMKMALMQLGVPEAKAEQILEKAYDTRGYVGKEVMSRAQKQGYDGLAQYHDGNLSEVVSYNPYSIKSATGNTGEFNPYDPRLSKKTGGKV